MSLEEDRYILKEECGGLSPNLERFCELISLYAFDGKSSKSNSHTHLLECFIDINRIDGSMMESSNERNNVFWQRIHTNDCFHFSFLDEAKKVSLRYVVFFHIHYAL